MSTTTILHTLDINILTEAQYDASTESKANVFWLLTDQSSFYTSAEIDVKFDEKVDKEDGKGLSTNDYTTEEKEKLAGIEAGADVNTVDSVNGQVGAVVLTKSDVGLGNVDNTSDANKPISTAVQSALDDKTDTTDFTDLSSQVATNTAAIAGFGGFKCVVVDTLPDVGEESTIYLIARRTTSSGDDVYNEYIYVNGGWELIGNTAIDLSDYYTSDQTDVLLANKVNVVEGKGLSTNDFTTDYKSQIDTATQALETVVYKDGAQTITGVKTFNVSPIVPTATAAGGAINKGQLDTALANVEIDVDDALSDTSENPVQNKVITEALGSVKASITINYLD